MESTKLVHAFLQDEAGVTSIEYALLGSLIAVAIMTAVTGLGLSLRDLYGMVASRVQEVTGG